MSENSLRVTSFSELQQVKRGVLVKLPPFSDKQPFVARLRRPSLMKMMSKGKIPNSLKTKANELFAGNAAFSASDEDALKDLNELLRVFAGACLIEPTMEQIEQAGAELTDEQLMFLFNYAQKGMTELGNFRKEQSNTNGDKYGKDVQNIAKQYHKSKR